MTLLLHEYEAPLEEGTKKVKKRRAIIRPRKFQRYKQGHFLYIAKFCAVFKECDTVIQYHCQTGMIMPVNHPFQNIILTYLEMERMENLNK